MYNKVYKPPTTDRKQREQQNTMTIQHYIHSLESRIADLEMEVYAADTDYSLALDPATVQASEDALEQLQAELQTLANAGLI